MPTGTARATNRPSGSSSPTNLVCDSDGTSASGARCCRLSATRPSTVSSAGRASHPNANKSPTSPRPTQSLTSRYWYRASDTIETAGDLAGRRVGAIDASVNLKLVHTFSGAVPVPFDGASDDVFGDMLSALEHGEVDAVVDDDVALVPLGDDPRFRVAFTNPTRNPWGIAVSKERPETLARLNGALSAITENRSLAKAWRSWMPTLPFPL